MDKNDSNTTLKNLKELITEFVTKRNWDKFQNMRSLSMSLSLESNELMDHFQWLNDIETAKYEKDTSKREEMAEELCDILSYILIAANRLNIDITDSLLKKLAKNSEKYPEVEFKNLTREEDNDKYQKLRKDWEKAR